tara:strand:+ start:439 stop:612 length:174 start_codon:yes stop_codon:yes gene_type:complete
MYALLHQYTVMRNAEFIFTAQYSQIDGLNIERFITIGVVDTLGMLSMRRGEAGSIIY